MTLHALVFTDVVDSTQLVERMGDAAAAAMWAEHDRRARGLLALHGGREIDRSDGFFLLFDDVAQAAQYALAYHRTIADLGLGARVGLHVGAVTLRPNAAEDVARGAKPMEVEGLAKPFAARIMGLARGGQTLLSAEASQALGPTLSGPALLECHGHYRLKGIAEPVEIFELGESGSAFTPPADTDKAYRVVRAGPWWQPLHEIRHNLAPERDAFIGRTAELRGLAQRLDAGAHLLTLLGPGGTGKTRLARRYARSWLGDWPGGVYFCDLSEARSLDGIHFAVALALDVPLGKDDPGVQLGHAIAGRGRCLVMLDNFEQVLQHAPATVGRWLDRAAQAAFIVTSRERLQLPGEEIFPIEPLSLGSEAIDLFEARARAQRPEFVLGPSNRAAVAEVVRLLDGLPLAIELAAARIRVFSPGQLVERMKDRFSLLAGAKGAAARQATLKAAIDWSWDLLTPWEQAALAQCSVFEGGFTMEAAEAVLDLAPWPDAPPAMDAVQALVDKSLLRAWVPIEQGRFDIDEPYFGMYLSIHEYAADKLVRAGGQATLQAHQRHGAWFAGFGSDEAIEALSRHGGVKRRHVLALDVDNLVLACRRAVARGQGDTAVAAYRAAWEILALRGPLALGSELGAQVLTIHGIEPIQRAVVSVCLATAMRLLGTSWQSDTWLAQALSLTREAGSRRVEGVVLGQLAACSRAGGRLVEAAAYCTQALAIHREVGDLASEGRTLSYLGVVLSEQGLKEEARAQYELALLIQRQAGNRSEEATVLGNLGVWYYEGGRLDEARTLYSEALILHRLTGNRRSEAIVLSNLGALSGDLRLMEEALCHLESALAIDRSVGDRRLEGGTLHNLGMLLRMWDRLDEARIVLEGAVGIKRETRDRSGEGGTLGELGRVHLALGQSFEARKHFDAALAIHRELGNVTEEGEMLGDLGELLAAERQFDAARASLEEGETCLREVDDRLGVVRLVCSRARLEFDAGQIDAARAALRSAELVASEIGVVADSDLGQKIAGLRAMLG